MSHFLTSCPFERPLKLRYNGQMVCIDDASGELLFETDNKEAAYFVVKAINQLAKPDDLPAIVSRLEAVAQVLERGPVNKPRMTGDQIRTARKLARLTQGDVAMFLGISVQAVSQWEQGKTVPDYDNVIKLQKLFPSVGG